MPPKKHSLGRGLAALISGGSEVPIQAEGGTESVSSETGVQRVPVNLISANRFQPRTSFNEDGILALAESIKQKGIIQPLLVRRSDVGRYELVCGERRFRAAQEAGLPEVPVVIQEMDDAQALELALVENLQREDLNPIDEANGYKTLMDQRGLSAKEIGELVGRNRSTVTNMVRLLDLDGEVKKWVSAGRLSAAHARTLLALDSREEQRKWAQDVIGKGLSVKEIEESIYGPRKLARQASVASKKKGERVIPPDLRRIVAQLERILGTRVEIRPGRKGGKIEIHYHSLDDFQYLLNRLGAKKL